MDEVITPLVRSLADLKVAQKGRVRELTGAPAVQQRLAEMGFTSGSEVRIVRLAPLGDPVQVAVRNYQLSLRRSEARCVLIDDPAS